MHFDICRSISGNFEHRCHHGAAGHLPERGDIALPDRDLDGSCGTDIGERVTDHDIAVGARQRQLAPGDSHRAQLWAGQEIGDQIAVVIDVNDLASNRVAARPPELPRQTGCRPGRFRRKTARQRSRGGGEDIATVKGRCRLREAKRGRGDSPRPFDPPARNMMKQTIVGSHEIVPAGSDDDLEPFGSDARIDHRDMDRSGRELATRGGQHPRAVGDVVARDLMCEIDDDRVRLEPRDHPFHRANKAIASAEIGGERDDHLPTLGPASAQFNRNPVSDLQLALPRLPRSPRWRVRYGAMDRERLRRIRNWQSQDWYPAVFLRPLSILIMLVIADWTFLTPNRLTTIANACKVAACLLLIPSIEASVAGALGWSPLASVIAIVVLMHLGAIFDHLDGTVARYRRTFTIFGSFYDKASDLVTWTAMSMALGWRAYVHTGDPLYIVLIDGSAFALAIRGYLKWAAHAEGEKLRWLRAKADPVAAVERATQPPRLSTPPERTAMQWLRWYLRSWSRIVQFEEMDLFFWVGLGLLLDRLDLLAWMLFVTQSAGMTALFIYRHIESHGYDVEKRKLLS